MPIVIPTGVFNVYNEAVSLFERVATVIYPERKEECPNCYLDTMGTRTRSVSVYKADGPAPLGGECRALGVMVKDIRLLRLKKILNSEYTGSLSSGET